MMAPLSALLLLARDACLLQETQLQECLERIQVQILWRSTRAVLFCLTLGRWVPDDHWDDRKQQWLMKPLGQMAL